MRKQMALGLAVVAIIGFVAFPATANGNVKEKLAKLKQADTNGDGQVTFAEAKTAFPNMTQEKFNKLDRNGDGNLSREDVKGAVKDRFEKADTDGDGKLSVSEAKAAFPRMTDERFKRLDRNGDGFLGPEDRRK